MRIRKQAKLAGVPISNGISSGDRSLAPIGLRCQLNQSPWDLNNYSEYLIGGDGDFPPNGSIGDSGRGVESEDSMRIFENGDVAFLNKCSKKPLGSGGESVKVCAKTDGKSWQCKNEVAEGQALCQHHLDQLKTYNSPAHTSGAKKGKSVATVTTNRRKKRVAPSSDVYYYYAGFGPQSAKQRGTRAEQNGQARSTPMKVDNDDQYNYIDDYESDEEGNRSESGSEDLGRKRARKPVKARSLKSLM